MTHVIRRPDYYIPEKFVTSEKAFNNRRAFLKQMGLGTGLVAGLGSAALGQAAAVKASKYPARRNPEYNPETRLSTESIVATYNNFYEFSTDKEAVHKLTGKFQIAPWPIEVTGLVEKPMKLDVSELVSGFDLEDRIYRFRCVEAWAMIVPWTGFPLSKLIEKVQPKSEAKFVKFVTFYRPDEAPGFKRWSSYPWPYTEGLRMDEAMNPLTLLTTGIYGKPLPKQNGAPVRIVVPWKYGYKSIKSVVKIEFVATQPKTLWETMAPDEYPFESNVDPGVPHPRWSQSSERMIDSGDRVRTQLYNGYAKQVGHLYKKA